MGLALCRTAGCMRALSAAVDARLFLGRCVCSLGFLPADAVGRLGGLGRLDRAALGFARLGFLRTGLLRRGSGVRRLIDADVGLVTADLGAVDLLDDFCG